MGPPKNKKEKEEKDKYDQWKQNLPIMYDWILNHPLTWPSQSCRWTLLYTPQNTFKTSVIP